MALVLKDRVKETTSSTGTGVITLLGAVQGYQAFSSIGNGNTTYYCIQSTTEWEVGIGVVGSNTLTRNNVLASSNNNNFVSFGVGVKDVFCTYPATKSVSVDSLPVATAFNTTAPNDTVNVASLTSAVATANGDIAIVAKGTGAILAQVPTGTIAGGNKRGTGAVDLQSIRVAAEAVASGDYSVISGGVSNRATGVYSASLSGFINQSSGSISVVCGGAGNETPGFYAVVGGGVGNIASGDDSGVVAGRNNQSQNTGSFVGGGDGNTASGDYSTISGGRNGTTRGIQGFHAFPACNAPISSSAGSSQAGMLVLAKQTTNATPAVLCSNASAASATNQFAIANNSAAMLFIDLVAWDQTDYLTMNGINTLLVRGANAASTVLKSPGYLNFEKSSGASTWTVALAADTTNGCLSITVTGQASKTIRWVARIMSTEVTF